jgi:hypothetical protein
MNFFVKVVLPGLALLINLTGLIMIGLHPHLWFTYFMEVCFLIITLAFYILIFKTPFPSPEETYYLRE